MIPEVHYFDHSVLAAVGDGILAIYQGTQIPELVKEVTFEEEIKSVFYGEQLIGLVFDAAEGKVLKLFDQKGNPAAEIAFDMSYSNIRIEESTVVIYNDQELGVYSHSGKECFRHVFETSMIDVFPTKSRNKYLFIYSNETQMIKLQ